MARSSPGVGRIAAILNFMADHPGQAFALTDLVRALKLSRATCHALLTGLVEEGYLYRSSDKTYVLGPALAAIGRAAAANSSPLQIAQPEMRRIADAYDVVCGAYFLEGDTVHLRDRAASVSHVGYPIPLGTRMPLRVPLAIPFLALSAGEAEGWLARRDQPLAGEAQAGFAGALDFMRRQRFVVIAHKPGRLPGSVPSHQTIAADDWEVPVEPLAAFDAAGTYSVAALFAPIVDGQGRVAFVLGMAGFYAPLSGSQIMAAGEMLRAACGRIAEFVSARRRS